MLSFCRKGKTQLKAGQMMLIVILMVTPISMWSSNSGLGRLIAKQLDAASARLIP